MGLIFILILNEFNLQKSEKGGTIFLVNFGRQTNRAV